MAKTQSDDKKLRTTKELLEARVDAMMESKPKAEFMGSAPLLPDSALPDYDSAPEVETNNDAAPEAVSTQQPTIPAKEATLALGPSNLDTPDSDAAIDDIVAQEADEVLAAEDAGVAAARYEAETMDEEPKAHGHPVFWFLVLLLAVLSIIVAAVLVNPNLLPSFGP